MTRIEKSIVIEAPVEKVFDFVTDFDNVVKTQPPEMEMTILSWDKGPSARVGFKAKYRGKAGGQVWEIEEETTELIENKRHVHRQKSGPMKKLEATDLLEPTEEGTKLTSILEYELPHSLLGKLIDKLKVRKDMEKSIDYTLKKTKELVEKGEKASA